MTIEELKKIPFRLVTHIAMEDEHCTTYASVDGSLGFCDHTKKKGKFDFGRTYRHWRIGSKVYKSFAKFQEALKDYNQPMTKETF